MRTFMTLLAFLLLVSSSAFAVVHVDKNAPGPAHDGASWDTAFTTIQAGVNAAGINGEVWVADGIYVENVTLTSALSLYGGFLGAEPGGYETSLDQRDYAGFPPTIDANGVGAAVVMAPSGVLDGFVITNAAHSGIRFENVGNSGTITHCLIYYNSSNYGAGIYCLSSSPRIVDNTIEGNYATSYGGGLYCKTSSAPEIRGNRIVGNSSKDGAAAIACVGQSAAVIADNDIFGNSAGFGAYGGGIWCGSGSCATISGNMIESNAANYGSGIACTGDSNAVIEDNLITGNYWWTTGIGGGIYCNQASPRIISNRISYNQASRGGGLYTEGGSSPIAIGNTIEANNGGDYGGGAMLMGGHPTFERNIVRGNLAGTGAGLDLWDYAAPVVGNLIVENRALVNEGGGIVCRVAGPMSTPVRFLNNTLAANTASRGAGMALFSMDYKKPGCFLISNTIIWNDGESIWLQDETPLVVAASDIRGGWAGDTNIDSDPLFADPGSGTYRLSAVSPCIDAGDNLALGLTYEDVYGKPRICDGNHDALAIVDMGADEYQPYGERNMAPEGLFTPGWVWFSIPLIPSGSSDASGVLGFDCTNRLFAWDEVWRTFLLYPDDFTELAVGTSYTAWLVDGEVYRPVIRGHQPSPPFERTIEMAGWCWVGVPGAQAVSGADVRVSKDGVTRTPAQDDAAAEPWINWNWIYWNPAMQTAMIMNPLGNSDDTWIRPWWGYRLWSNTENVTLIIP